MFVGNIWILISSVFHRAPHFPEIKIASAAEIPLNGVKLFGYPTKKNHCILVRTSDDRYVAYSQKCTHLSCAVYYSQENRRLECPCHEGFFSIEDGSVLQGPPPRALPRVELENRAGDLVAIGMKEG